MDTPRNIHLTFCAQQAKCFRKNILRNNNKLSARIIHTYRAGCVAEYATNVREHQDMSCYGTWACQRERLCTHCIKVRQHLVACSRPHTHGLRRGPKMTTENPGIISGALRLETPEVAFPVIWTVSGQVRKICTVLGDVTMGYRTDHRPLTGTARSSEKLVYNYTT
jgi:hypothetical protein